ncbi:MAG TPA: DUF1501 domain-containing protein [Pirellulaceae bacterium]|nr:DUF1501 domain-containing protein [Pirellulaceae bacterium]
MLRIHAGGGSRYCDGLTRRSFVQLGIAGMASVGLPNLLRAEAASPQRNDRSVILIWLDGGPSHLDLYDLKPQAPSEYRGIWKPIRTVVPGIEISELFPLQAQVADKFSIVRSLHHDTGDHFAGGHRMLTTKDMGVGGAATPGKFPSIGSIVAAQRGPRERGMPAYAAIPYASSIGLNPGYFGGNWMGAQYDPFATGGDPNSADFRVANLNLPSGMTIESLQHRRSLVSSLDRLNRTIDARGSFVARDRFDEDAFDFVTGERARQAFDLSSEPESTRELYGRNSWGQSVLLARRLVEAGTTFVTVHFGGWDHHWDLQKGMENYLPMVDAAVAGLLTDLDRRGQLESTMVVLCGEFSRTPRMNDGGNGGPPGSMGTPGRDHWGDAMFCLMGGGGIRGGMIVGETDAKGMRPISRPVRPENIHATIYRALGIDPKLQLLDHQGRPTSVLDDPTPIDELLV